jgi:hypothetical protein
MTPSPDAISGAAALLGVPAERLALLVPLMLAMTGTTTPDELLAVASLNVEQAAIRAEIKSGRLPSVKLGRALYVRRSDLLGLVAPRTSTERAPSSGVSLADLASRERSTKKRRTA